jgi:hypothetical protein
VQKRRQNGAADEDVGKPVRGVGAQALTVALCAFNVVGSACRLVDAGEESDPDKGNRIGGGSEGKLELQLRRERYGVGIIDDVEIGDDAKNTLLFLNFDLFDGDLLGGRIYRYRGYPPPLS